MANAEPRYAERTLAGRSVVMCEDCGALVLDQAAHTRFHSILGSHAWALAVLKTAHLAAHVHDRYEVGERIDSKRFDNWSAEALAEVVSHLPASDESSTLEVRPFGPDDAAP